MKQIKTTIVTVLLLLMIGWLFYTITPIFIIMFFSAIYFAIIFYVVYWFVWYVLFNHE